MFNMMEDFEGESDVKIQQYEHQLCGKCAHSTKHSRAFVPYYTNLTNTAAFSIGILIRIFQEFR